MDNILCLNINPNNISPEEWSSVYKESLQLIKAYPFMDVITDRSYSEKPLRYSIRSKERKIHTERGMQTGWKAAGDMRWFEQAEAFTLISSLDYYKTANKTHPPDIYFRLINRDCGADGNIFSSKTEGLLYHKYILAIACLIEDRLKPDAVVFGDINRIQAEEAVCWANTILDYPIEIPDRCFKEKLQDRMQDFPATEVSRRDQLKTLFISEAPEISTGWKTDWNSEEQIKMDSVVESRMTFDICTHRDFVHWERDSQIHPDCRQLLSDTVNSLSEKAISVESEMIKGKSREERKFILTSYKTPFLIRKKIWNFITENLMRDPVYTRIIKLLSLSEQNDSKNSFFNALFNNQNLLVYILNKGTSP